MLLCLSISALIISTIMARVMIMKMSLTFLALLVVIAMASFSANGVAVEECTNGLYCVQPYLSVSPLACEECCKMYKNKAGKAFKKGTCISTGEINRKKCDCSMQ